MIVRALRIAVLGSVKLFHNLEVALKGVFNRVRVRVMVRVRVRVRVISSLILLF